MGAIRSLTKAPEELASTNTTPQVSLASIAQLSNNATPLQIVGTVTSVSQASVSAQSSGAVTGVNYTLGDWVSAGAVVATLENATQRAALLQAQGALDAAQAAVNRASGTGEVSAKSTAVNALLSAYGAVDSAIRATADTMIIDATGVNPRFTITTSNSQLALNIGNERLTLGAALKSESARAKTLTQDDDLAAELQTTIDEVRAARTLIDTILQALAVSMPDQQTSQATITANIAAATAARASLTGVLSSLAAAQTGLGNSAASGGYDLASAQATVKQAQGAVAAARASVEKTIIRAPISGTINSFSLKVGDFVNMNAPVLTVANNGALEIVAYITDADRNQVSVGNAVAIEGGGKGTITRIAPALDPITKRIEIRVGITSNADYLNGQSVLLDLQHPKNTTLKKSSTLSVPLNAIKVGASNTVVFTVSTSSTLVARPVVLGELQGDRVVITQGVTPDLLIVTDARGLHDGEEVIVK